MLCRLKFSSSKKKNVNHSVQCYHSSHCFPERSASSTNTPDGGPLWMKGSSPGCCSMPFPTYSCILSTGSERPAVAELPSPHCRRTRDVLLSKKPLYFMSPLPRRHFQWQHSRTAGGGGRLCSQTGPLQDTNGTPPSPQQE